jgi:hypothetical protein
VERSIASRRCSSNGSFRALFLCSTLHATIQHTMLLRESVIASLPVKLLHYSSATAVKQPPRKVLLASIQLVQRSNRRLFHLSCAGMRHAHSPLLLGVQAHANSSSSLSLSSNGAGCSPQQHRHLSSPLTSSRRQQPSLSPPCGIAAPDATLQQQRQQEGSSLPAATAASKAASALLHTPCRLPPARHPPSGTGEVPSLHTISHTARPAGCWSHADHTTTTFAFSEHPRSYSHQPLARGVVASARAQ